MDVLVKWDDGTINVVYSKNLKTLQKNTVVRSGVKVKMYWPPDKKYYYGVVTTTAKEFNRQRKKAPVIFSPSKKMKKTDQPEGDDSSDDNIPLSVLKKAIENNEPSNSPKSMRPLTNFYLREEVSVSACPTDEIQDQPDVVDPFECSDSSGNDPTYTQRCNFKNCKLEIFAACHRCPALLCWDHFINNGDCKNHYDIYSSTDSDKENVEPENERDRLAVNYAVDGEQREVPLDKEKKGNKKKIAHAQRTEGKAYVSSTSKKPMPPKLMKPRCDTQKCKQECSIITEEQRQKIFDAFYGTKSLQLQREFIARHVTTHDTKRKRTSNAVSRRTRTFTYRLTNANRLITVCKTMFLNTLGISEKTMRTSLNKLTEEGIVLPDARGGRHVTLLEKDSATRSAVLDHIQLFPRMESHFCRQSTTREYLHPDLTIKKMYYFYKQEGRQPRCSYHTYRRVFKSLNLSFHHPKKDQCSLCSSYKEGNAEKKAELQEAFAAHTAEKESVRNKKKDAKELSKEKPEVIATAVFDLQQVISLPRSNESAIFYRRRLSVFNFTIYNLGNRNCFCYLWNEIISKRGSNEISTCVANYLHQLDNQGIEEVRLFADGCGGQNKNTIVLAMLLHTITNAKNIQRISLCFFETNHGQSEGDSAHSSISTALALAGDVFIPAQLPPILKLARRNSPYTVIPMDNSDFLDYKSVAVQLRIRSLRKFDSGEIVDYTKIKEVMVKKDVAQLFLKTSHLADQYYTLSLKRNTLGVLKQPVPKLNNGLIKLDDMKYKNLVELCTGPTPVVRDPTCQQYFKDLPHH